MTKATSDRAYAGVEVREVGKHSGLESVNQQLRSEAQRKRGGRSALTKNSKLGGWVIGSR